MPNPCPPHAINGVHGPFRIGFTVDLPTGYVDRQTSWGPDGMIRSTELTQTLITAWNEFPPELEVALGGRAPETVWCGTEPLVFKGSPFHREASEGPDDTDAWVVEAWVYAPDAPTSEWLDYPYIAQMWVSGQPEVALPGRPEPARLTLTDTVYLINGRFIGVLPSHYTPPPADSRLARAMPEP